jgi:UPF0176 protein
MQLSNKIDKRILKQQLAESKAPFTTISFYKYQRIDQPQAFRDELYRAWHVMGVVGRIYIAQEGINAQLAVPEKNLELFDQYLNMFSIFKGMRRNYAVQQGKSFYKLKIQVKDKIVADGINDPQFDSSNCGVHLNAEDFNNMMSHPDAVVVDFRNHYESEIGHFENAILPDVDTFREQLPVVVNQLENHKDKPVLMYCTGGIRCEKASAYLKHKGFTQVYQLEGGIIKYARDCKTNNIPSRFIGKNFVFDERLGERITDDIIAHCHQCGAPADTHTNCANDSCHLLFIQCEACKVKHENCCCDACKEQLHLPEETKKALRRGVNKGRQVFKKGRWNTEKPAI